MMSYSTKQAIDYLSEATSMEDLNERWYNIDNHTKAVETEYRCLKDIFEAVERWRERMRRDV